MSPLKILAGATLAVVAVVSLALVRQLETDAVGPTPKGAFDACLRFAAQRLTLPANSKFSSLDPEDVESRAWLLGQHPPRFEVTAQVDSPNGSGALLRSHLSCDVSFEDTADRWNLAALSFSDDRQDSPMASPTRVGEVPYGAAIDMPLH